MCQMHKASVNIEVSALNVAPRRRSKVSALNVAPRRRSKG